ncbi:MAG: DUF899 domain-containing protein [Methylobacteriaceae bacterium]|nr:DUF899 domain-containing protein [Methylobacteriaceae bacterium]
MQQHPVVSREEWIEARTRFLAKEKEFTRLRDELSEERRALPWVRVDKKYVFEGPAGRETLADLFGGRHQLIVYHFMFDPSWEAGCKSCSFWADNYNGIIAHLNQRDVTHVAVSRAPLAKLEAFRQRMGWTFKWVSSHESDFNFDYQVSFRPEDLAKGEVIYNYAKRKSSMTELPGLSVFYKDDDGQIFHTYSCYARGLDLLNSAYNHLDLVPKGRDEADLPFSMSWVRLHDIYDR